MLEAAEKRPTIVVVTFEPFVWKLRDRVDDFQMGVWQ